MHKKICLVFPRMKYPSGDPPLGVLYIASYLKKHSNDISLDFIDTTFNPSLKFVERKLKQIKPGICAIYSDTLMYNDALAISRIAKKINSNVIIGGPHASIMPESILNESSVDTVAIGEGELTLKEYGDEFFSSKDFKNVDGIWFRQDNKIIKNKLRTPIKDLDILPFPAVDLLDFERYIKNWYHFSYFRNIRGTSILGTRGCLFNCSYCQPTLDRIFGKELRKRSPEDVIKELRLLRDKYRINAFHLQDDTSTAVKKWMISFCRELIKSKMDFKWSCNSRANTLDEELILWMKRAGAREIRIGIESISTRIRNDVYNKNISEKEISNAINIINKHRMNAFGYFMIGGPGETESEIRETIKFAINSGLRAATFSIATPLPGTHLYKRIFKSGVSNFESFDYYTVNKNNMSKITRKKLDYYKKIAYLGFYTSPKRLGRSFKELLKIRKSILKFKRF